MLARTDHSEADNGPRAGGVTARLCAVSRKVRPIGEMVRFVVAPDGALVPDLKRRLPGRGVWVAADRRLVAEAVRRGVFQRSLRTGVTVSSELPGIVEALMEQAALDALGIARKAGLVVSGFAKVEAAAERGNPIAYLRAADAGADGARKIAAAIERGRPARDAAVAPEIVFTSAQLDLALGRTNVVHAALLAGRASETFLARWRTLECYRTGGPGDRDGGLQPPDRQAPTLGTE